VHLLALLAARDVDLSELVVGLPSVHVVHERVAPFERKGVVMRKVVEAAKVTPGLIDGVKTFDAEGWTLIVPDRRQRLPRLRGRFDDASSRQRVDQAARDIASHSPTRTLPDRSATSAISASTTTRTSRVRYSVSSTRWVDSCPLDSWISTASSGTFSAEILEQTMNNLLL